MEIVKKNILSILCGVVALAAVILLFFPISGWFESLQSELNTRGAKYTEVETLRTAPRKLPTLVLNGTEQAVLDRFPNEQVIKVGQEKTASLTAQSKNMLDTVTKLNVREPLVPGSLPRANSQARNEFPGEYLTMLGWGEKGFEAGIPAAMKATRPPTMEEISIVAQEIWDKDYNTRIYSIGNQTNEQQVGQEFMSAIQDLPKTERTKRANNHLIYLDDTSLPVSPDIQLGTPPTDIQIWFAQTVLWIEQDVASAIIEANKGARNVMDAPVKHLVALSVPFGPDQYVLNAAMPGVPGAEGAAPPVDANGAPAAFTMSPTGRVCNDLYDVIHFDLVLRVDYRKIPQIMTELERNRLFTVLSSSVMSVDAAQELKTNGYVYGNDPIAELTLRCEALFLRSWTVDKENNYKAALMPDVVQQAVGAKPGAVPPGAMPGGDPGMMDSGMMEGEI
jgi:hypothetical protein